jgi:hypothetical protein
MALIVTLVILNIPVFLFLAWLAFDSKEGAARTFGETMIAILQIVFIPRIVRVMFDMDDEGALGLVPIVGFFIACGAIVFGEYWLVTMFFPKLALQ